MYQCRVEDIKHTPNPNYVHIKSEFQSFKYQYVLEEPETTATERKFTPFINDGDPKNTSQCSLAPGITNNLESFADPGRLAGYNIMDSEDLSHKQLVLKKEMLENDFIWNQKEMTVGNGQKRQKEIKQKYSCDLCDSSYKEKFHLDAHLDIFHDRAGKHLAKDICSNSNVAFKENRLEVVDEGNRIQEKSSENILYLCYSCNEKFSKQSSLAVHMHLVHNAPNDPTVAICIFCHKSFDQHALLDKHILRHHPSWRPFSCHICGESFALVKTLNEHQATHKEICTDNKIQNDKASENIVRLNYTACPIPPTAENIEPDRLVFSKRKKTATKSKERRKKSSERGNRGSENKQEPRKYRYTKTSLVPSGSHSKKSQNSFDAQSNDNLHNEIQENGQTKRRRIEIDSAERSRDWEQLFQYECMQCQLEIPSLNCLFRHADLCHKKVMQIGSSSNENQAEPSGHRRNIQLDCRMGGRENSFGNIFAERNSGSISEIAFKKQALLEKILNKGTNTLAKQLLVSCGFCEFTATNFLEFNDHLLLHGM